MISLSPANTALAREEPPAETGDSPETRTADRIAAASLERGRTIAVEVHRNWPYPDWLAHDIVMRGDSVVVAIVEESSPDSRWEIVAIPPMNLRPHAEARVVSVQAIHVDSVVVLHCDDFYGLWCTATKVFFDAEARKALGRVKFEPLGESTLLEADNAIYSVMERKRFSGYLADALTVRHVPGAPVLVSGAARKAVIAALPKPRPECRHIFNNPILGGGLLDDSATPLSRPSCFTQIRSSPPLWTFNFPLGLNDAGKKYEHLPGIAIQEGESYLAYPLPQSTPEDMGLYRRKFQATLEAYGLDIASYTVHESIEVFALHAKRLWFGKSFNDGEGYTGVGSLGYFDIEQRIYKLIKLPELADWSTSAILIEKGAIWIGLARHPEGASYSGGLLRYEIETKATQIYPIKEVVTDILHYNGALYVASERGQLYVLRDDSVVAQYSVEPALDGGFEIRSLSNEQ